MQQNMGIFAWSLRNEKNLFTMNTNQYIQRQQLGYTQFMTGKPQKSHLQGGTKYMQLQNYQKIY